MRGKSVLAATPYDRQILRLAVPALGALAADPLVTLVDTAFVGRLGATELGALGINAAVFSLSFALFNFLAYGTTPPAGPGRGGGGRGRGGARGGATAGPRPGHGHEGGSPPRDHVPAALEGHASRSRSFAAGRR